MAHGTVDMAITTMNRQDFCAKLIGQLADDEVLRPYLDTVFVMDQGSQPLIESEYFPAAAKSLGDKLRVIVQDNLGGSGGYAYEFREYRPCTGRPYSYVSVNFYREPGQTFRVDGKSAYWG